VASILYQLPPVSLHKTQETRVYNVEDDVAGIICQALPLSLQLTQETRVYSVGNDVAGIICQTPPPWLIQLKRRGSAM